MTMKKLLLLILILLCVFSFNPIFVAHAETGTANFFVCANSAILYASADLSSERLETLQHKTIVLVETEDSVAKEYVSGSHIFYKATHNETTGFVLSDFVLQDTQTTSSTPNFNGKTNSACFVFRLEGENYVQTTIKLERRQKIFMYEGYHAKKEYTAISFVYENEVMYGYIETKYIAPNGINPIILTCICLIVAILGIAFSWIFVKKRKKKMA